MSLKHVLMFLLIGIVATMATAEAQLLGPGASIIAIDTDPPGSFGSYPGGEAPALAIDGETATKYLNFGGPGSGFITTPSFFDTGLIPTGLRLTTANDAPGRDPTSYQVWGTNDAIVSTDNSDGLAENWTLIAEGGLSLPGDPAIGNDQRGVTAPDVLFANATAYMSYKVLFPTVKSVGDIFQIGEVELLADASGFDPPGPVDFNIFSTSTEALAVHFGSDSRFPGGEPPSNVLDFDSSTKYLNFGEENSGFIVTSGGGGPSLVRSIAFKTANDAPERDPTSYELYGTNDPITSEENSQGDMESWTLISSGSLAPRLNRFDSFFAQFDNAVEYESYRLLFPTIRDADTANSMQIADVQFWSTQVPEPSSAAVMIGLVSVGLVGIHRRR